MYDRSSLANHATCALCFSIPCRLLAENEELQRRLQRGGLAPAPNSFGKKDE